MEMMPKDGSGSDRISRHREAAEPIEFAGFCQSNGTIVWEPLQEVLMRPSHDYRPRPACPDASSVDDRCTKEQLLDMPLWNLLRVDVSHVSARDRGLSSLRRTCHYRCR